MITVRTLSVIGLLLSLADFIGLMTSSPICSTDGCTLVQKIYEMNKLKKATLIKAQADALIYSQKFITRNMKEKSKKI